MIYIFYNNDPYADDQGGGAEHFRCIHRASKNSHLNFKFIATRIAQTNEPVHSDVEYISKGTNFFRYYIGLWFWFFVNKNAISEHDVFHFHRNYAAWPKYILIPKNGKVIITYHGITGIFLKNKLGVLSSPIRRIMMLLERKAVNKADRLIVVSRRTAESLKEQILLNNYNRVSIIPAVLNTKNFSESMPPDPNLAYKLVIVSRLSAEKNIKLAIDALFELVSTGHNYTLTIAGDGDERNKLFVQSQNLGLADRITFLGRIPNIQVPSLLQQHGIVLLTSHVEASPTIVKEAIFAQRPIVTTDVGDVHEWLDNKSYGFICQHTVESVAEGIQKASVLVSSGMYNRTINLDDISESSIMNRVLRIYDDLSAGSISRIDDI
ncbi:phosphatidylinositol N-acetylglucosaminyltransferase subunit A [Geobacter sp. OR-1]|uniref:glycosyltransferase family 4 protein n=1 Tax=Geobacter sp. OR-1 TaxID=1266765 RepID=UPI000541CD7D|nr:glycosyltransferase family 4 protein [Geobacter sp. OR-1]GAM10724.1 phosphatidylinositol N-acetylglucosaminyltransferase subunit A [Geobacter sp. OR-1]